METPKEPERKILTSTTIKLESGEVMQLNWYDLGSGETWFEWVIIEQKNEKSTTKGGFASYFP